MKVNPLSIEGAWEFVPQQFGDARGMFMELYKAEALEEAVGHALDLRQANLSVSAAGVVRGIHFADVPPSQAKYVTCVKGAVLDVIVDIRVGSPTFGKWEAMRLDDETRNAVYISEGLGHGFCALTEGATVTYLCSEGYAPQRERGLHPLDAELGVEWPVPGEPELSAKDAEAPTLAEAKELGILPRYEDCVAYRRSLASAL
ncbi:dTDP-4-dehydrorhamnose 3,5-epimerase [Streptomyces acidiscabies]|uniref:dTDP-4-dehydrorhamnose 3,5-epimerase n=1 Tax=Streptomyces acidiscabies TaxID=42234 RepID=A0AAP6EHK5_9ACTN|nr:dTDP-4-dehydrorhamnose 3,5-epimerase [Streptomyces acidiscabies]MBP5939658.1 dTDP-4-dehydrorhamnose 3,5-epimerase [Streptomyces sp. LBUM 1476]MBZ3910829.1 dTDP-4-dehydrorhamnose 3,5-epimerase [Streptomyces acidiscabies]MDX2962989.1 dTDP-4-dehydrorhamnose 3,5-epimerase [Streptomyces acidiscabies]MDX3017465.1 dTDP-4-dehydrorhamnose 3,5-epimerase [Streptomyces acidiscabies]MDX3787941.1 dTDP-4-dehydrorhamnose 3,5-epimerase [Streptomyces acidiscabies]